MQLTMIAPRSHGLGAAYRTDTGWLIVSRQGVLRGHRGRVRRKTIWIARRGREEIRAQSRKELLQRLEAKEEG